MAASPGLFCGEITQNHADNEGRHPGDDRKGVGRGADGRSPKGPVDDGEKKDEIPCVPCRDSQNALKALCVVGLIAPGVINHHPVGARVQSQANSILQRGSAIWERRLSAVAARHSPPCAKGGQHGKAMQGGL